jgi:hypothetical protein
MSAEDATPTRTDCTLPVDIYVMRIDEHLMRLARGHDPLGHLFAVERLARGARAEWWSAQRQAERRSHGR